MNHSVPTRFRFLSRYRSKDDIADTTAAFNGKEKNSVHLRRGKAKYARIIMTVILVQVVIIYLTYYAQTDPQTEIKNLIKLHLSESPAHAAGRWEYNPKRTWQRPSEELLQCLDLERQGNCHDSSATNQSKAASDRADRIASGGIKNSPGILVGHDPWVWTSNNSAYNVLPWERIFDTVTGLKIYLIGDSLTRQWAWLMRCEFEHILGLSPEDAGDAVQYCNYGNFPAGSSLKSCLSNAKSEDYVIFNFGHHLDPCKKGMEDTWRDKYEETMKQVILELSTKFDYLPPSHIFFRTTSVRHYAAGKGDWNTNSSSAGGDMPNMKAVWKDYGGDHPVQPAQNLIGMKLVNSLSKFGILDTSPLMLARADATSDGSHFCLPGPMTYWSAMLYNRIHQNNILERA